MTNHMKTSYESLLSRVRAISKRAESDIQEVEAIKSSAEQRLSEIEKRIEHYDNQPILSIFEEDKYDELEEEHDNIEELLESLEDLSYALDEVVSIADSAC